MRIIKAVIVRTSLGSEKVFLHTDMPSPIYPYTDNLIVDFDAASGYGYDYVKVHFGIEPEVIEC